MSTLDFQDREPELERSRRSNNQIFGANAAFYERLQGQGRKGALERYGWIALPVAVVAIFGVVAVTSTPHETANDVVGAPGQKTAAASTPAPAPAVTQDAAPQPAAPAPSTDNSAAQPAPAEAPPAQ